MSNFEAIEASYSFLPDFSRPEDSACSFVISFFYHAILSATLSLALLDLELRFIFLFDSIIGFLVNTFNSTLLKEYSIWIEENLYNMWVVDAVDSF